MWYRKKYRTKQCKTDSILAIYLFSLVPTNVIPKSIYELHNQNICY